jgi:hypothetical protein
VTPVEQRRLERIARERDEALAELKMHRASDQRQEIERLRGKLDVAHVMLNYLKRELGWPTTPEGRPMKTLHSLLAECEHWLGVEPLGDDQWAEVAELRERVRAAVMPSASEKEPLTTSAASFLSDVAAKRGADGLE